MTFRPILLFIVPLLLAYMLFRMSTQSIKSTITSAAPAAATLASAQKNSVKPDVPNPNPFPSFFFSHGGPTFIYEEDGYGNKGAWKTIKKLGTKIKNEWKPDYIVVVSAHWQLSGSKLIEIGVPSSAKELAENELVYDFYGFPKHMYQEEFHTLNSRFVAEEIRQHLKKDGLHSELSKRGLDHGVWVPFKVAFSDYNTLHPLPEGTRPGLDLPETSLVQVSLTGNERDFDTHFKLGQSLSHFRDNLIWDPIKQKYLKGMVICSGMSVHNLRDLGRGMQANKPLPYTFAFNKLLKQTMVNSPELLDNLNKLKSEHAGLLHQAHPTLEHFVPIVVAGGLLKDHPEQKVKEIYNDEAFSLGWGIYQFGDNPQSHI